MKSVIELWQNVDVEKSPVCYQMFFRDCTEPEYSRIYLKVYAKNKNKHSVTCIITQIFVITIENSIEHIDLSV